MELVLIGGTGRSGTSFTYRQILKTKGVCGFESFESTLFTANVSLIDVYDRYVNSYTPDRYDFAAGTFRQAVEMRFANFHSKSNLKNILDTFYYRLHTDRFQNTSYSGSFQQHAATLLKQLFIYNDTEHNLVLEKTPHNILVSNQVKNIFPGAKIIHMVRDPRAVAESVARQPWGPNDFRDAVIWVKKIQTTLIQTYNENFDNNKDTLTIRIEDFTTHYKHYESIIQNFIGKELPGLTLQSNADTLDKWRANVSPKDIVFSTEQLRDIFEFYSYDPAIYTSKGQASLSD